MPWAGSNESEVAGMERGIGVGNAQLAYAGEVIDEYGFYLLGGRLYGPALHRFVSPDTLSPFDRGGFNRYAYSGGDPVNRIDPSGHAWWEWLVAGIGLVAVVAGTVATGGALAGVVGAAAAGSLTASTSTVSMAAMTAAALVNVVSVAAEIGSAVSLATQDAKAGAILGWIALGTGVASVGLAGISRAGLSASGGASRYRSPVEPPVRFARRRQLIQQESPVDRNAVKRTFIRSPSLVPDSRFAAMQDASMRWHVRLKPKWIQTSNHDLPGVLHFGADTAVARQHITAYVPGIVRDANAAPGDLFFYTGVHGHAMGRNWNRTRRIGPDPVSYFEDVANQGALSMAAAPHKLVIEDISNLTVATARENFRRPGIHVHAYCFSAVDEVLLDMFGIIEATPVYESRLLAP
ncbi:RHS repeat-associated core domain-containing protein [Bacillus sp. NP157]|nr:RHS repeat-associated core domain-containing protein [Bacillus sp. NP157]